MAPVKNIIFDLGGVLLNIDFKLTGEAFKQLGVTGFSDFYSKEAANHLFEKLETGFISNEDFYAEMQRYCRPGTSFNEIQVAWNAILVSFRKESVTYLPTLKKRYDLYLLSNTNSIHHIKFSNFFREDFDYEFDTNFIKAYYSHEMHQRKPYVETYLYVLESSGLDAASTLFIDDTGVNIEGAKRAGLQTHLLLADERIERLGL